MLTKLFDPQSIALVGASRMPGKLGYDILSNLKNLGFTGGLYPVNPKGGKILGLEVSPNIESLPKTPDLVLIAVPAPLVNGVIEECGQKGIKDVVVISAGFKEIGGEGTNREIEMQKIIKQYNINLVGPNCLGIVNTAIQMNASFAEGMPMKGNVSLISQSGAMAVAMIDWAYQSGLGFAKIISMGNKAGLSENELLEYLGEDPDTKVILMYLESILDGQGFLELARKISLKKPIIILKSGTSEAGTKAISSHTGSLAGSDTAVSTAFDQGGIIRAHTAEELFDYAKAFSYQSVPQGKRVAIITNAGGPAIMATDSLSQTALELADISKETEAKLATGLPATAALHNPVDVIGDALVDRYRHSIEILLEDPNIDSLLVILTPQVMTEVKRVATVTTALAHQYPEKTVLSAFIGGESIERGEKVFRRHKFPNYIFPERAINALNQMYLYGQWKQHEIKRLETAKKLEQSNNRKNEAAKLFADKKTGDRLDMNEIDELMRIYGVQTPKISLAKNVDQAIQIANEIGYPVVMKIVSPQIYHKTDVGGIRIDIQNDDDAREAFDDIMTSVKEKAPEAEIDGVSVEAMLSLGKEVIIGAKKDPQFGHMLMFGLGGIYVEILKDVIFRISPINHEEALKMISEIRAIQILKGARGEKPVNLDNIAEVIVKVCQILTDFPQIQEFEMNPLIATEDRGTVAVDTNCIL